MKKITFLMILAILMIRIANGQHQNFIIQTSPWGPVPTEPSVAINPANTEEILVGAMSDNYYVSTNGGYNWSNGTLQSQWGVHPVILVDNAGRFYYIHLPNVINRAVCHRKENISAPWSMESSIAYDGIYDVDKEWAAYDPVNDKIYLSWTYFDTWGSTNPNDSSCIYMSWSADAGQSWCNPVRISDEKGNASGGPYSMHGSYPTTGPNGEVYIAWWGPAGLLFDRSLDQGTTWLPEDINITGEHITWIYPIPAVNLGVSFPVSSCDRSGGAYNGNIYICFADRRNGYSNTDVFIVKSSDQGLTWSDPILVNDDQSGKHQFFPFITVDQATGKVWLVFFDRRNYTDTNTDVYMAMSADGGETFTNFQVSETPFIPYSSEFFGRYIALAAHNDVVIPVWNRMDEGISTLMGARVDPLHVGAYEQPGIPTAELINSPNPFTGSSLISFKLKQPGKVSLKVYELSGKLVSTLIDQKACTPGKYVEKIDGRQLGLKPGVYKIELTTGKEKVVRKVVFGG